MSTTINGDRRRAGLLIGAALPVRGIGTTTAMACAGAGPGVGRPFPAQPAPCSPTVLPGTVVDVTVSDIGSMTGPGMNGGMMGHCGMMRTPGR